eukprot:CAMPEP_0113554480 /NCGR_PEP_ID=MMETSP0015_2-20120614/16172_1 /TAXON_ID=2838 /ORGANISM="Odontella" /LENGTH=693 /DNA_ID=CAMNT_0000455625 /DNA_START=115 /DNA_END=2196 /DNA_ORIENTATION=+ /assembly_acc=CAM_ASM_000160
MPLKTCSAFSAVLLVLVANPNGVDGYHLLPRAFAPSSLERIYEQRKALKRGGASRSFLRASPSPLPQLTSPSSSKSSTRLNSSTESVFAGNIEERHKSPLCDSPIDNRAESQAPVRQWGVAQLSRLTDVIAMPKVGKKDYTDISTTIPSGQPQLPVMERIMKALYEESLPWILSFIVPAVASLAVRDFLPIFCSLGCEFAFLLYCTAKILLVFDKPTTPQPRFDNRDWDELRDSVWSSHPDTDSRRSFLMGWFYDAPFERLRREDALTFLAWKKHGVPFDSRTLSEIDIRDIMERDLLELEKQVNFGAALPSRDNCEEPLACIRFNLEPLRYRHKPTIFYLVTHGAFHFITHVLGKNYGFKYVAAQDPKTDMSYWYRPPKTTCDAGLEKEVTAEINPPLVFVHGVGGLAFYYNLLAALIEKVERSGDNTPIIFLDLPHVSLRMYNEIPTIEKQVDSICRIMDKCAGSSGREQTKATFVGHSFGSIVLSWMVQSRPERVGSCVFMDPICFQLHQKDTLFNFHLQRVDKRVNSSRKWQNPISMGALINMAGTEMHTNNAMLRHFWWATNALWPHDLAKKRIEAFVLLSGDDDIVPSSDVANLFDLYHKRNLQTEHNWSSIFPSLFPPSSDQRKVPVNSTSLIKTHVIDGAAHGEFVFDEDQKNKVVRTISTMMRLNRIKNGKRTDKVAADASQCS